MFVLFLGVYRFLCFWLEVGGVLFVMDLSCFGLSLLFEVWFRMLLEFFFLCFGFRLGFLRKLWFGLNSLYMVGWFDCFYFGCGLCFFG